MASSPKLTSPITVPLPLGLDPVACVALQGDSHPFFLDSGMAVGSYGRWSFVGADPFLTIQAKGMLAEIWTPEGTERREGDPLAILAELLERFSAPANKTGLPFIGGAVGYLSYDLCHFIERLPRTAVDDVGVPDLSFAFYDTVAVFDHETGTAQVVATDVARPGHETRAEELTATLSEAACPPLPEASSPPGTLQASFTPDEYRAAVARVVEYIYAGDLIQVNLSQRFSAGLRETPWELYRRLRAINPAPFAAYLGFPDTQVVSASPERFLRVEAGRVETRPIKGTRPRGKTPEEDAALADELRGSVKDNAELVMIVDLERNDIGRVCQAGTVRVPELVVLESYPTVHHLVATVVGDLETGRGPVDLIRATFPGGSITGAPKVRAMEIIDEMEPTQRGIYTGSIGYIGFDGSMDLNIAIRTIVARNGKAHFQVGGGIVADSVPEAEYRETLDKGRALAEALGYAI